MDEQAKVGKGSCLPHTLTCHTEARGEVWCTPETRARGCGLGNGVCLRLTCTTWSLAAWQEYLYFEFPSETVTRSGYNILRKNFVVAAVKR